eukprot:TRINITY_DN16621_c0_g1_i1.p1 TRINITY_DN16621_c0_g1~~TRINITY_DN16621_c0_g1_i1.p1  ORF type:complete len:303 (+),score=57.17 TRINITY_DN16621_c0_g1_i1:21-929(+)
MAKAVAIAAVTPLLLLLALLGERTIIQQPKLRASPAAAPFVPDIEDEPPLERAPYQIDPPDAGFDGGVFVLNLRRRADRKAHMRRVLQPFGLRFQWFMGIDAKESTGPFADEINFHHNNSLDQVSWRRRQHNPQAPLYHPARGKVAVSITMRELYRVIAQRNGSRGALFMEDDIGVRSPKLFQQLPRYMKMVPADWDLVFFGYCTHGCTQRVARVRKHVYRILRCVLCTHMHAVSTRAARMLQAIPAPPAKWPNSGMPFHNTDELLNDLVNGGALVAYRFDSQFAEQLDEFGTDIPQTHPVK